MNKTAIVTGSAGNLGKAVVKRLLDSGMSVAGTILAGEKVDEFTAHSQFEAHELDVTNEKSCQEFVRKMAQSHSTIDAAALLVGGFAMGSLSETSGEDIRKMFRLNFESAFYLAKEIFGQMSKQASGGRIILVGARPALDPNAGKNLIAYALSKGLLFHFADLLNAEGRSKNVVTSVIVPSIIDTPDNRAAMPNAHFSDWVSPEQIAEIIYFITSDAASILWEPVMKVYGNA